MSKIKKVFPQLSKDFYDVLCDRMKVHNFSDVDMIYAVNNVIDTCTYPIPTVANFIKAVKENSCPYSFVFGKDFEKFAGCCDCKEDFHSIWRNCKLTSISKKG